MMTKGIIGAVIGDIAGSSHEFSAVSSPRFKLFDSKSSFTDDTALTAGQRVSPKDIHRRVNVAYAAVE